MTLRISPDLTLPDEAVTESFAILAKRGAGKTYTAKVLVEEMVGDGHQVVTVDPIGVWWGLRSSADGAKAGLPVVILGGDHADAPLEPTGGEVVADLIVDEHVSVVLDLSGMRKGEQRRFMTDFAERLYHRNRQALHVVIDEADAFAPQRPVKGAERLLGAIEDLVRRGRARGLGVTLISQRSAVLNKDVLTQAEVLVAMRMTGPQDRAAIDEWVKVHGDQDKRRELMEALKAGARAMLDELVAAYPDPITRDDLGERTGYAVSGGTFSTYLGMLRRNGLVDVDGDLVTASETLFLGAA